MPNFIVFGYISFLEPNFPGIRGIETCFNVECVLLGRNFDLLGGYLVVTAHYLVVTGGYCLLPFITARSHF